MNYPALIRIEITSAGKYKALVSLSPEESEFFKFHSEPTEELVLTTATEYMKRREEDAVKAYEGAQEKTAIEQKISSMTTEEKQAFIAE